MRPPTRFLPPVEQLVCPPLSNSIPATNKMHTLCVLRANMKQLNGNDEGDEAKAETAVYMEGDAYLRHFTLVLNTLFHERPDLSRLFSTQETAIADAFLTRLTPQAQYVYARLFQRKGDWFKTSALLRYFERKAIRSEGQKDEDEVDAVGENDDASAESAEAAVDEAHVNQEQVQATLQTLVDEGFFVTLPSLSAKASATGNSQEGQEALLKRALDALQQCANAAELASLYKTLVGKKSHMKGSLSSNKKSGKADLFQAIERVVLTQRRIDGSRIPLARLLHQVWLEAYPLSGAGKSDIVVLQASQSVRDLFLRMHRLFYFQSSHPFNNGSAVSTGKPVPEIISLAQHHEATQWPGLMEMFKKIQYPSYKIQIQRPVFTTPTVYACYEVAYQLHRLMGLIDLYFAPEIAHEVGTEPDLDFKWLVENTPQFEAFQRLASDVLGQGTISNPEDSDSDVECLDNEEQDWQLSSWTKFRLICSQMQTLDDLVIEVRSCFSTYLNFSRTLAANSLDQRLPPFLMKCDAGYHFARILNIAVNIYEKQRKYQIAILLLNDLLASPYLSRKRGGWWNRLSTNLEHIKCVDQSKRACENAIDDPHTLGADRITLERRMKRLQKGAPKDSQISETAPNTGVDLISENDDIEQEDEQNILSNTRGRDEYVYPEEHIIGRPLNRAMGEKSRFIGYDDEPCTVEQLVLQHYQQYHVSARKETEIYNDDLGGWYGIHCEGRVLGNLFGLLLWDVIYANVPDVFRTPFQGAPLDFGFADTFYEARKGMLDSRLNQLQKEWTMREVINDLGAIWHREFGKISRFVSWSREDSLPLRLHQLVVLAMGQERLVRLLRYMATSPEYHVAQNGLPDLLLLRVRQKEGPSQEKTKWPTDDHKCLNVYKFCEMAYQLNLNDRSGELSKRGIENASDEDNAADSELDELNKIHALNEAAWDCQIKLVEVKGPRDRLSDKQLLWLEVLNDQVSLLSSVTHVVEDEQTLQKIHLKRNKKQSNNAVETQQNLTKINSEQRKKQPDDDFEDTVKSVAKPRKRAKKAI